MRTNCKRYTKYADNVIMKYVKENPDNLKQAFRYAAFHLNRTVRGVEQRYYNNLYERPYWEDIPQTSNVKPKKEKIKFTITFGKFCVSITER